MLIQYASVSVPSSTADVSCKYFVQNKDALKSSAMCSRFNDSVHALHNFIAHYHSQDKPNHHHEQTCLWSLRPVLTQTGLLGYKMVLGMLNLDILGNHDDSDQSAHGFNG